MKRKWLRNLLIFLLIAVLLAGAGVWNYARGAADPQAAALAIMQQPNVTVEKGTIAFAPSAAQSKLGFIFYQGGLVEEAAYAPLLQQIALAGYPVYTPAMPLNLAVLGLSEATDIIDAHPEIEQWVIGGHSLGGAMSASYVAANPDAIAGLVLLASYPADSADLSQAALPVLSVFADNDGLATARRVRRSASLLPADSTFVEINGGNHAQFGDYGVQEGDGVAQISAESQWQQTSDAIISFLNTLDTVGR